MHLTNEGSLLEIKHTKYERHIEVIAWQFSNRWRINLNRQKYDSTVDFWDYLDGTCEKLKGFKENRSQMDPYT